MIRHRGLKALHFGPTPPGDATVKRTAAGVLTLTRMLKITPASTDAVGVQVTAQCQAGFKYEPSITAQQGAWVLGLKVEATRAANVQPVTGGWIGVQAVLDASSEGGYALIDKPAYAIYGVIKGNRWGGSHTNCGRFETQSDGKVDNLVYVTANTGSTVGSALLEMSTHVTCAYALLSMNVQSSVTQAKGLRFTVGAGSALTSLLYAGGDGTFTNFLEVSATGKGGVTLGTGMFKDPESDQEAGYLTIKVGAVSYQIPCYASS